MHVTSMLVTEEEEEEEEDGRSPVRGTNTKEEARYPESRGNDITADIAYIADRDRS
jgi:hypothetical protein